MNGSTTGQEGLISRIVSTFLDSKLSLLLIILSLSMGVAALIVTPREEEPQIIVPMADVFVSAPGASPEEIEKLVATPLERLLWQIDGVEYVYSVSQKDVAVVTVRFFVGEDREDSLIKLHNRISMHVDEVSSIIQGWVVKPVEIDDVSIVNITLFSETYSDYELRRIGEEVLARLSRVENISRTAIHGGRKREIRVELSYEKMDGAGISFMEIDNVLRGADASVTAGKFSRNDREYTVALNSFLASPEEAESLVVGVKNERPVYLRDVARVLDVPEEAKAYTKTLFSTTFAEQTDGLDAEKKYPSITLAVSKKKGTNAVKVAQQVIAEFERIRTAIIPDEVKSIVTRNYGETAQEKVSGLLSSLFFAIVSVVILLALTLGWREAVIVALAVPISFSLALFVNYLLGYTINRVTLFALILSLGLVVDDPITNVENIQRHIKNGLLDPMRATLAAVQEVLPPVIMSTLSIIVCFTPLFFITGMMGPYMGPMAANVPLTVIFSTLCALTIVPWFSHLLLKSKAPAAPQAENCPLPGQDKGVFHSPPSGMLFVIYRRVVEPFLNSRPMRVGLLVTVILLLLLSCSLALFRLVPLKLLPFDNKNEFQVIIDMPEGTPLERTDAVVQQFEDYLQSVPEVTSIVSFTGDSSPMDFNGMVRHYYLRKGSNFADIRVNLAGKKERKQQSHAILLRLRKDLETIAQKTGAVIKLVEVPPGPPVLSTLVGEIYGSSEISYDGLVRSAGHLKKIMEDEPFVVDIDDMTETPHQRVDVIIDKEKAALHGISTQTITRTVQGVLTGTEPATLHLPHERQPLTIRVTVPRAERSSVIGLKAVSVKSRTGRMIPLAELVDMRKVTEEQPIYHKNLERVVYVLADTAGRAPAEAVLDMQSRLKKDPMPQGTRVQWAGEGEWKITIRVFRDMGIAFAAAIVLIYILLVIQSGSFFMPMLIMMAIPLTLLGIMPGFLVLNLVGTSPVGGFENPIFFTATSMIGMIALGGIVIRNSLVLIEFIHDAMDQGVAFKDAIVRCGAIRMRPIMLTAMTTAIGAFPITFDPVFSGLAWALIFGLMASTMFTLLVIPVTYYAVFRKVHEA